VNKKFQKPVGLYLFDATIGAALYGLSLRRPPVFRAITQIFAPSTRMEAMMASVTRILDLGIFAALRSFKTSLLRNASFSW
jgi:hypothetical protein